jgi:hypothetical protein
LVGEAGLSVQTKHNAEEFPEVVADGDVAVVALLAKRTFWEKTAILHAEYFRPPKKLLPSRYSRHYYDVAMLAQWPIRAEALADRICRRNL